MNVTVLNLFLDRDASKKFLAQDASPTAWVGETIEKLRKSFSRRFALISRMAVQMVNNTAIYVMNRLRGSIREAGIKPPHRGMASAPTIVTVKEAIIAANVSLIKSIPEQYLNEVSGMLYRALSEGKDRDWIAANLEQRYGITSRRAAFIARDQITKTTRALCRAQCLQIGSTDGIWQHSNLPEHPRHSHVLASGTLYSLVEGCYIDGKYIQPGEEPGCQCGFKPILTA